MAVVLGDSIFFLLVMYDRVVIEIGKYVVGIFFFLDVLLQKAGGDTYHSHFMPRTEHRPAYNHCRQDDDGVIGM